MRLAVACVLVGCLDSGGRSEFEARIDKLEQGAARLRDRKPTEKEFEDLVKLVQAMGSLSALERKPWWCVVDSTTVGNCFDTMEYCSTRAGIRLANCQPFALAYCDDAKLLCFRSFIMCENEVRKGNLPIKEGCKGFSR